MNVKYYFAASYDRYSEMRMYRNALTEAIPQAEVTSRWIDCHGGKYTAAFDAETLNTQPEHCWSEAGITDAYDLMGADVVVSFTRPGTAGGRRGGRHVEFGWALGLAASGEFEGPRLVIIGPRENLFHCHPLVEVHHTWNAFLANEVKAVAALRETGGEWPSWLGRP